MKLYATAVVLGRWQSWHSKDVPLRLGVSACLLGENVRYDGGHARDRFVADTLGQWFEFVPVCPEMEIGMGMSRPTVRRVEEGRGIRLVAPSTGEDFTERMLDYAGDKITELMRLDLDSYILKKGSLSCGMERIRVYRSGMALRCNEVGLFARTLMERWPALPMEEEGRLNDRLGKLVASAGTLPDRALFVAYESEFQAALAKTATKSKHANVLYHAPGYLKRALEPREKRKLLAAIEDYRQGLLPLVVPLTLLRYEIRRHSVEYLAGQLYFDPHPKELMLRNHA
jgi:uncharacterized protein YbbK (DUF523 family)